MREGIELETAIEIIGMKIAICMNNNEKDKIEQLLKERKMLYGGNEQIIEKVLEEYSLEVKEYIKRI